MKNFKEQKPIINKEIIVEDFWSLNWNEETQDYDSIYDGGHGVYLGEVFDPNKRYKLKLKLNKRNKEMEYLVNSKGKKYHKQIKDDADFKWEYK